MSSQPHHKLTIDASSPAAVTRDQMREVDRLMVEEYSVTLVQMMENAGRNLAELAGRMLRGLAGRSICVVAGADVNVVLATDASGLSAMPAQQLGALRAMGIAPLPSGAALPAADLYVDGIVGYSLRGALRGRARDLAAWLNAARGPILSLDVPTRLDVDSGEANPAAVRAAATMTLALPKPGLLIPSARPFVGQLYVADISVPPALYARLGLAVPALFSGATLLRLQLR